LPSWRWRRLQQAAAAAAGGDVEERECVNEK
jgi:hypothetical protein